MFPCKRISIKSLYCRIIQVVSAQHNIAYVTSKAFGDEFSIPNAAIMRIKGTETNR